MWTLLILTGAFYSCEKTIEFKEKYVQPKIVVNAILRPGAPFYVRVESSRHVLDEKGFFEAIKGAQVLLYENGTLFSELGYASRVDTAYEYMNYGVKKEIPFENGIYLDTGRVAKAGATYRLEITKEGFDPVWCETTVPVPVELDEMDAKMKREPHEYMPEYYRLDLNLEVLDNKNQDDFYRLTVNKRRGVELELKRKSGYWGEYGGYGHSPIYGSDSIVPTDTIVEEMEYNDYVYSNDPALNPFGNSDILGTEAISIEYFTDELLNRDVYDLSFWVQTYRNILYEYGEFLEVIALVESMSKELFLYSRSLRQQDLVADNPFAEPVPVYSNVHGGLGIFGSMAGNVETFIFGEYPIEGKTYIDSETYWKLYTNSPY